MRRQRQFLKPDLPWAPTYDCQKSQHNFCSSGFKTIFPVFLWHFPAITGGAAEPAAPCPHKAGTAPSLGAEGGEDPGGEHENGTAELRAEAEALALAHAGAASPLTERTEPAAVVPGRGGHDGRLGAAGE